MSRLSLQAQIAARGLDVDLEVPDGQVLALLGANGSGKSSTLEIAAGLLRPDAGRVQLGETVLLDTASGHEVPAHARGIALLRQEALLFPHLSAVENVAFGPRAQGLSRRRARDIALERLADVEASDLADRRPAALSGGQAQRIAVARALAAQPELLLLDEPFSALDVEMAPMLRRLLRRLLTDAGRTAVLVTHDLLDALALADVVAVLDKGRIVEQGPTRSVFSAPRSSFAARIAGVNLLPGRIEAAGVLRLAGGPQVIGRGEVPDGESAVAIFAPAAVVLSKAGFTGSARNVLTGRVLDLSDRGGAVRVRVALHSSDSASAPAEPLVVAADVTAAAVADLDLVPGEQVQVVVKAQEVALHSMARH
ncbi:sulfate/molybdate ABC transporter ATP-binding protein [Gephyromycinifex aptenodytis]|uniref:sulfate/molybdate ABC transporter ATP-binding protein n=1 Tax=Gephyromycinifex aptenodytis TaxID=2716227 RepID=UPI0014476C16|nr:ATP-binding cassette domain-containing protein [Gephyromycinifex aptenodytis]